jgi:hypothetical protein
VEIDHFQENPMFQSRECSCGSGEYDHPVHDARGIYVCRCCEKCEEQRTRGYRRDIFTNPSYECDEPIEPADYY